MKLRNNSWKVVSILVCALATCNMLSYFCASEEENVVHIYSFPSHPDGAIVEQILPPLFHRPGLSDGNGETAANLVAGAMKELGAVNASVFSCEAYAAVGLTFSSQAVTLATLGDWDGLHRHLDGAVDHYGRPYILPATHPFAQHADPIVQQSAELRGVNLANITAPRLMKLLKLSDVDLCAGYENSPHCLIVARLGDILNIDWRAGKQQSNIVIEILMTRLYEARWAQCGLRKLLCSSLRYLYRVGATDVFLGVVETVDFRGADQVTDHATGDVFAVAERSALLDFFAYVDYVSFGWNFHHAPSISTTDTISLQKPHCFFVIQSERMFPSHDPCAGLVHRSVLDQIVKLRNSLSMSEHFRSAFVKLLMHRRRHRLLLKK